MSPIRTLLATLGAAAVAAGCIDMPTDVRVSVDAPAMAAQGEEFAIAVHVRNDAAKEQVFVDLDIADEYLEGISIRSTDPPFVDSMHVPIDNTQSYTLDLPVDPGGEVTVRLVAVALKPGDFSGDFDFCINSELSCLSHPVRTLVK